MAIYIKRCLRCGHEWATKQENPRLCPRCKSAYWDKPAKTNDFMKTEVSCPICSKVFSSFLNLARHIVLSDRHYGPHQEWLTEFLGVPFEEYAFGKDKAIALKLKNQWDRHHTWSGR
jgi:DNA-directed RNA polymerase subunit RPC12/RpoP